MNIDWPTIQFMEEAARRAKQTAQGGGGGNGGAGGSSGGGGGGGGGGHDGDDHIDGEEEDWETEDSDDGDEDTYDDDDTYDEDTDDEDYDDEVDPNEPSDPEEEDEEAAVTYDLEISDLSDGDYQEYGEDGEPIIDDGNQGQVGDDEDANAEGEDIEEDADEEEEDDEDEEFDFDDGPEIMDDETKIEELSPRTRADYRPIYPDEDILSDFSGDEKYAPKDFISGNDGEGDQDMVDFSVYEESNEDDPEFFKLTAKIRELMLNLKKGRAERERKLRNGLGGYQQQEQLVYSKDSPMAPYEPPMVPAMSPPYYRKATDPAPFLHRLLVRGRGHPREIEHSPAISNHFQCANSMVISPSTMGLWDDIFTIHLHSVMRCGVLERNTPRRYQERVNAAIMYQQPWADVLTRKAVLRPYAKPLRTVKASKFMDLYNYRFDQLPESEDYIRLEERDDPLCIAHRYGYMAHGAARGSVVVYCTQCEKEPYEIHYAYLASSIEDVMLNSLQIVRWNRYHRSRTSSSSADDGYTGSDQSGIATGQDGDDPQEDCDQEDLEEGYPSKKTGQFDHYLIMAGNMGGLFIAALPDHPNPKNPHKLDHNDMPDHPFKYKEDHTWIRSGFGEAALNDAKASPNGRWIAVVGDSAQVWTIEVTHVPETEEQRIAREKREEEIEIEDLETDSEYASDDSMGETEAKLGIADPPQEKEAAAAAAATTSTTTTTAAEDGPRGAKRSRGSKDSPSDSDVEESTSPKTAKPTRIPRLLHQFGQPYAMLVPDRVLFTEKHKRNRQPRHGHGGGAGGNLGQLPVTFQYVAWNATSTKFAHSSDTCSRVVVWSMPAREIVCCVDTGGPSYSIEFHPKLENLFAVANWYGFVHIVDLTGACVGDEELVPSDTRYNGQAKQGGPGLAGCEGPHYEEKHDILMVSFRGQKDRRLRIYDGIRGLGWSTDGRNLYVSTLRRVLKYEIADWGVRVPSLFDICGRKVKEWKERELHRVYTNETERSVERAFAPMAEEWPFVPVQIKRKIFGEHFLLRSHDE
ncbi:hypothetical protein BGX33_011971 [Mortierella sp. NVP41]|nr:hypothetical protein BGX33_011971 [Mortierella sp. NVP41]